MLLGKDNNHRNLNIEYNGNSGKEYVIHFYEDFLDYNVIAAGFDNLIDFIQTREYAITHSIDKKQKFSDEERETIDDVVATHNISIELKKVEGSGFKYAEAY